MKQARETFITAFALFSLFFGAGNLILPPQLGFRSGTDWWLVTLGFCLSAVLIPIMGILAHGRLQGTMYDFGGKVSHTFSLGYCFLVYSISISLPSPRTASVTHEMAVAPLFQTDPVWTSIIYFLLVFIFVMNRSRILDIIGRWLTPIILIILLLIIALNFLAPEAPLGKSSFSGPFSHGILEGYQTFDAIGAVVVGGVILVSLGLRPKQESYATRKKLITRAGWLAGLALFLIYAGLIYTGAINHSFFDPGIERTALLSGIGARTLGNAANIFLSVLVSLACFTTAVGIVTGTADFVKSRCGGSSLSYTLTAVMGCLTGILVGQYTVGYIIAVAIPALMFIYPVTIVLILMNVVPSQWATPPVFKAVVGATLLFSIPDFLAGIEVGESLSAWFSWIPLSAYSLGWVLPALVVFVLMNLPLAISRKY